MFSSTKCVEILRQKWPKALWRDEVCGELQNSENENSTNSGFNQKLIQTNHSNRSLRMHAGKNIRSQNANPKKHPSKNREMDPNPGQPELLNQNCTKLFETQRARLKYFDEENNAGPKNTKIDYIGPAERTCNVILRILCVQRARLKYFDEEENAGPKNTKTQRSFT
jgi:hypothetical protein